MDAVAMRLLEIGEAVKGISPELTATEPDICSKVRFIQVVPAPEGPVIANGGVAYCATDLTLRNSVSPRRGSVKGLTVDEQTLK